MARVRLNWYIESLRGKVADCDKEIRGHVVKINPVTGELITQNIVERNLAMKPYTEGETRSKAKFRATVEAVNAVMADPDQLASYVAAFRLQKRYRTLRGYVFAEKYKTVTV